MKTIILALRDTVHGRRIDEIYDKMTRTEQIFNNKVKREEGSEVFKYYRRELIEMINLTNHMKGCEIQVDENSEEHWISSFLLPPDFSVKDDPDVDKALQKSPDQDFTTNGTEKRLNETGRLMIDHHTKAMAMSIHIESYPNMLLQIADALTKVKTEKRGRPRKGA
jgi:hypothetical protein